MAKQRIEIGLSFSADTSKAKGSLQQLEKQLNSFLNNSVTDLPLTKNISAAQEQATKLSVALKQAVNIDTGKFDLSKFQSSLKKSNTDLKTLRDSFVKAGPEGTKTFMALAQSIVAAEVPTKRMNAGLEKMLKTLKDTARWQISSNIMHGLQGALQEAYGYAQDLNKSLNDIRIVTGYSADQMEDFAVSANKAAKALSTTTNEYTKASLIYFQQGLSDQEVIKRTQTTIKMANVTGEAAEDVSSYMTAVWNNFDDGSKKLEYYADAITALGAATASSSEEIATGLQKFSAVANTVGLSYEYATAALATVTSQTRESAETVGTAFKTIFARLESLSLGETLDDDTTMTKYSQALAQVGVNIKTANGDLKDMDTIIDELGGKWNSISKDQQIALAQTVAGMRQYNNFIALLDNYETMKLNVEIAADSEGTLDEQASIYAESWEAASDRVRAAAETIYEKILDDDFFIDLLNGFEKLLGLLDKFIDSAGGLQGILFGVSSILLKTFSGKAAEGLENMAYNVKEFFGLNKKEVIDYKNKVAELTQNLVSPQQYDTPDWQTEKKALENKLAMQLKIADIQDDISATALAELKTKKEIFDLTQDQSVEMAKQAEEASNRVTKLELEIKRNATKATPAGIGQFFSEERDDSFLSKMNSTESVKKQKEYIRDYAEEIGISENKLWEYYDAVIAKTKAEKNNEKAIKAAKESQSEFDDSIEEILNGKKVPNFAESIVSLSQSITSLISAGSMVASMVDTLSNPDTSGWEKFLSIFTTMTMILPMVFSAMKELKSIQWESMALTIKDTAAKLGNAAAAKIAEKAERGWRNAKKDTSKVIKSGSGSTPSGANAGGTAWSAETWKGLGSIAGKVGLVTAGILLIVGAIAGSIALYNKADNQAKKAEKQARNLKNAAAEAKEEYKQIVDTVSKYEEGAKGLEELTKDTQAWKEKLQETNEIAGELIEKFGTGALSGKYRFEGGQIVFDDGALEALQEEEFNKSNTLAASAAGAQVRAIESRNVAQKTDLARELDASGEIWTNLANVASAKLVGTGAGALIGLGIGGPIGAAIGAAAGSVVGQITGMVGTAFDLVSTEAEEQSFDKLANLYSEDSTLFEGTDSELLERLTDILGDEVLAKSMVKNREAVEELTKELVAEKEQIQVLNKQMAYAANQDIKGYATNVYEPIITALIANQNFEGADTRSDRIGDKVKDLKKDALIEDYVEKVLGGTLGVDYRVENKAGKITLQKKNEEGEWETTAEGKNGISKKDMREALANALEMDIDDDLYDNLNKQASNLAKSITNTGIDFEQAIQIAADKISNKDGKWDLSSVAPGVLAHLSEASRDLFGDAVDKAQEAWGNILNNYSSTTQKYINNLIDNENVAIHSLSSNALSQYAKVLDEVYMRGGVEAQEQLGTIINDLMNSYPAHAEEIANIVNNISWEDPKSAIQQLKGNMYDIGIMLTDDFTAFEDLNASVLSKDIKTIREEMNAINKIVKEMDFGSVISDEDYNTLTKYNAALKQNFIMTANGYKYIGKESLANLTKEANKSSLQDNLKSYRNARVGSEYTNRLKINGTQVNWSQLAAGNEDDQKTGAVAKALANSVGGQAAIAALGYDIGTIKNLAGLVEAGDENARTQLEELYSEIIEMQDKYAAGLFEDQKAFELYASEITTLSELNQAFAEGNLGTGEKALHLYNAMKEIIEDINLNLRKMARENLAELYDFQLENLEHHAFNAAKKIDILTESLNNSLASAEEYEEKINNLGAKYNIDRGELNSADYLSAIVNSGKLNSEDYETIGQLQDGYISIVNSIYDTNQALADTTVEYFSNLIESYDRVADKAKDINGLLDSYKNIIELVGKGTLPQAEKTLKMIAKSQETVALGMLDNSKKTLDALTTQRNELLAKYELAKQNESVIDQEYWDEQFDKIDKELAQQQDNFQNSWIDALKATAEVFQQEISSQIKEFSSKMAGEAYDSLDSLSEAFERQSTLNDQYVDDYKKVYEFSKLTRNIEKSISNTQSVKAKSTLRDLQAEITELQESGKELSEYDLEYLQKRYDLKLAEIAMDEAQNAKSIVRLQRDAAGNWGYVYSQNADEVTQAAQNYEDKFYALQEQGAKYIEETSSQIVQVQQEMYQALEVIWNNTELTTEEKIAKSEELKQYYIESEKFYTSEMDKALSNNQRLYLEDAKIYAETTGSKIETGEGFATSFNQTVLGTLLTGYETAGDYYTDFADLLGTTGSGDEAGSGLLGSLQAADKQYADTVANIFETAEYKIEEFGDKINKEINGEGGIIGDLESLYDKLDEDIDNFKALDNISEKLASWWDDDTKPILQEYIDMVDQVKGAWNKVSTNGEIYNRRDAKDTLKDTIKAAKEAGLESHEIQTIRSEAVKNASNYDEGIALQNEALVNEIAKKQEENKGTKLQQPSEVYERDNNMYDIDMDPPFEDGDKVQTWSGKQEKLVPYEVNAETGEVAQPFYWPKIPFTWANVRDVHEYNGKRYYYLGQEKPDKWLPYYGANDYSNMIWYAEDDLRPFDTGGYTGSWGPEGRLALLHQKEIVLNASDTANLLASVSLIRDITKQIDLQAAAAASGFGSLAIRNFTDNAQTLQQDVTIHAEFPNVTNHNEIEQAFDTLINRAAQYTNRSF